MGTVTDWPVILDATPSSIIRLPGVDAKALEQTLVRVSIVCSHNQVDVIVLDLEQHRTTYEMQMPRH